jgi:hypothetical protein
VVFALRDGQGRALGRAVHPVEVAGTEVPRFGYRLALHDDGSGQSKGDGDGVPEVGEVLDIAIEVTNLSGVAAVNASARLRSKAGPAFDLRSGAVDLGELGAGQVGTGRFTLGLRAAPPEGEHSLELLVGDGDFYDYGAVLRAGFYEYPSTEERIRLPVREPGAARDAALEAALGDLQVPRQPPQLEVTRRPAGLVGEPWVVISGAVSDDGAVKDVLVYHSWQEDPIRRADLKACSPGQPPVETPAAGDCEGMGPPGEKKVFYRGGAPGVASVPFTVEQQLREGPNTFVFLAHDDRGLSLARSVTVTYRPATAVSATAPAAAAPPAAR